MKQKIKTTLRVLFCSLLLALTFSITVSAASATEATIGKKKYSTLQKAVNVVKKGQTIKLRKDIVLTKPVEVKRNVKFTVDMNKHVITSKTPANDNIGDFEIRKGTVTLKNGTMKGKIQVEKGAKLTINGGTYKRLMNYGTTTILNGTFKVKDCVALANLGGTLTIKKAVVNSNRNCVYADKGKIVINGGNFKSAISRGTYPYATLEIKNAQVIINNGKFIGQETYAIRNIQGKLTLNGGIIQGKNFLYSTLFCDEFSQTLIKKGEISSIDFPPAIEIAYNSKSFIHTGGKITSKSEDTAAIVVWVNDYDNIIPEVSIVEKYITSPKEPIRFVGV